MATYTVTNKYLIDNFAVLQLLTPSEIAVGSSITVAGVDATFNGTYTVRALPQYLFLGIDTQGDLLYDYQVPIADQVLYAKTASDVERVAASGTVANDPVCTWVTAAQVMSYLGITITTRQTITRCSRNRCQLVISSVFAGVRNRAISTL